MDFTLLRDELFAEARRQGWAAVGVTDLAPFTEARDRALDAIAGGRMDGMPWYTVERVHKSTDLASRFPWARSLLALAWPYRPAALGLTPPQPVASPGRPRGRIAAYACLDPHHDSASGIGDPGAGDPGVSHPGVSHPGIGGAPGEPADSGVADYHDVLAARCDDLLGWLRQRVPDVRAKRFVDHGWAMDRAVAERAGIGFAGKHASVLTLTAGSYVLLAEMLLSPPLPPTPPSGRNCGRCSACIPACPTGAIVSPGVIDAPRCISYLTIEHRGPIPLLLRPLVGTWIFGCDLCQEACPINMRRAPGALPSGPPTTAAGPVPFPDLIECLQLDDDGFAARFRRTSLWRTGRAGLARNAAVALGNAGDADALPALRHAATADPDEIVREAANWAVGRLVGTVSV